MPALDRDKLRAGLSGILSGASQPAEAAPTPPSTPPAKAEPAGAPPQKTKAASRRQSQKESSPEEEGEHVRTTTGYVRADGERVHRVSIMLTKAERRQLRDKAEDAGLTVTDLVRRALDL